MRELLDLGATHTIMGSTGLQIAFECGKTVTPVFNLKVNMINGDQEKIIGLVELPIEITGVTHHMEVSIFNQIGAHCLLGADSFHSFNAVAYLCDIYMTINGESPRTSFNWVCRRVQPAA